MLLSLILFVAPIQDASPAAAPAPEGEIVVMARKLRAWRGKWRVHKGRSRCATSASTGDREIDAIGCDAMLKCAPPMTDRMIAAQDRKLDVETRKAMQATINADLTACVRDEHERGLAALADRRAGL